MQRATLLNGRYANSESAIAKSNASGIPLTSNVSLCRKCERSRAMPARASSVRMPAARGGQLRRAPPAAFERLMLGLEPLRAQERELPVPLLTPTAAGHRAVRGPIQLGFIDLD